ncbi:MAG: hypothetical protein KGN36_13660 [Acidobacteriota bacterium]|nr:hypothetical protein [Acidobacteriota bacterium]
MLSRVTILILGLASLLFAQQWPNEEDRDQARERDQWFYQQRMWPGNSLPAGARRAAIQQMRSIDAAARARRRAAQGIRPAAQAYAVTTDSANWTPIGPQPTNAGPGATSGRVNAIAIDPRDNNVVYVGGADGGVWKTTDGGATWTPLTDSQPSLAMGALALDPGNPDIVYAGTGEENFAGDSYYGAGILKSTDGGATWTNIAGPFTRDYFGALAVQPSNGQVVLAAARSGIWRSADGGATWTQTSAGVPAISIFFDPADTNSAWATLGHPNGNSRNGVYRSSDAGLTWRLMSGAPGFALPTTNVGRIELAVAPSAPSTLYAQIQDASDATFGALLGIWKTTDAGATWTKLPAEPAYWGTQLWYDNAIRVSPNDPNQVWSGALQIYRSSDGGATWNPLPVTGANGTSIHVDFHALAFTPDGSRLWLANDGGVYSTTGITAGSPNWNNHNGTLALTQFYPGMAVDPTNPAILAGGTQDNGSQRRDASGAWSHLTCGDGGYAILDPAFPAIAYAGCQKIDIRRNAAVGATPWTQAIYGIDPNDARQFIAPLLLDPSNPKTLYFGTAHVWQSRDAGGRWQAISPDLGAGATTIKTIAVAPGDSATVYAASGAKVKATSNALDGANAVWSDRSAGLPTRTVTRLAVDAVNPSVVYAVFSGFASATAVQGYVFSSADGGVTWTNITGNLPTTPVNDIAVDPDLPRTIYLATDIGVQLSTDGGATWSTLGNGLPNVVVHSLLFSRSARVLRAGTHGRSAWEIALPLPGASLAPVITSLAPATVNPGGAAFSLAITGSGFVPGTVIRWNGQSRPTHAGDSAHLSADIPAADIALPGRAAVSAFNPSSGGGSSQPQPFLIGSAPQSASNAFVSAANPTGGSALAQRSIASLYGTNLASAIASADAGPPLPLTLGDTTLTLSGSSVPLFFVSPGQINFQVPLISTSSGTVSLPLTITQGARSTTITVQVRPFSPALFTANAQGTGQASTVIAGTATLAAPADQYPGARPAKPGEYLSIYCTGLGDVSNRPVLGAASPSDPLSQTLTPPAVTIGGVNAPVTFSGLAPGFVGLYQINVQVPDGIAPGGAVPLTVTIGGVASNTATIAVGPAQ